MMKKEKWLMFEIGQEISIDMLIELLEKAREEFGGDVEVRVSGCYASEGEIHGIGRWEESYEGVYLQTDLCSG